MNVFSRMAFLATEIERLQDEKLEKLKLVRATSGMEKVERLEEFLKLNKEQEKLEAELDKLEND
jgi:hypothetical protein